MDIRAAELLGDFSLEVTSKDVADLPNAAPAIPAGAEISVTFLPGEDNAGRLAAAGAVRALGFRPVPHLSARQFRSEAELARYLDQITGLTGTDHVFVIAGDSDRPLGPYSDALSLIERAGLPHYGIRKIGVAGYPDGHPMIATPALWRALADKQRLANALGLEMEIVTQFTFDAAPVLDWLAEVRARGIDAPVRVGIPGPATVKTLLRFAARCGVGASSKVMRKYGLSLTKLLNVAGPDALMADFAAGLDPRVHGAVRIHLYPFGGLQRATDWARQFRPCAA
jgi:methylenetetrahydrofolate reductase (NADPH)